MEQNQHLAFYKNPAFILSLILSVFFLKGVFLAVIFPIFKGQDESRHYNTIQYLTEPKEKTWEIFKDLEKPQDKERLETYNFSEEIRETVKSANLDASRMENFEKTSFSNSFSGANEEEINSQKWQPYNKHYPPDILETQNFYHKIASQIENAFSDQSILTRFYLIRIFSVLLGTLSILFSYLMIKKTGFSSKSSLVMAAIISFQPRFSIYFSNINYDALLIFLFAVFSWAGISSLKEGLNWKNGGTLIACVALGILTKGTAAVLLAMLVFLTIFHIYKTFKKTTDKRSLLIYISIFLFLTISTAIIAFREYDFFRGFSSLKGFSPLKIFDSLGNYLPKTTSIASASKNYWGDLGWTRYNIDNYLINAIWFFEFFSVIGLGFLFFSKKKPDFLPEKKYLIFLILIIIILQIVVRLHDWMIFNENGKILAGTPGRYFLPNLTAHIILVFSGIGMLLWKEKYFEKFLLGGLVLMFSFSIYQIFNVIIPRFYL
ncbi:MAG: DUF2142 domain-containing protein [bacterium]|nr:DUF2142 domain-containing protein [bacterium]